jgi:RNA polymerase sigma factor (sigma-70 family)
MHDASDIELLRDYNRQRSEAAFAELVKRHINLVYTAALRHVGIAAHAEEITQAVFVILARKAASLRPETVLDAWLYETTRLTSLSFLRGERRRQFREQEAYMQSTYPESTDASVWLQLAPLLDEAMARLNKKDREAVVLRFFKQKNLGEVAAAMKMTEAAAQSRVHRAVEKLRTFFLKRGIDSTAATIAEQISANSIQAAPVALAKSVTAVALAKGATVSASTLTLIKGALKVMAWTKAKTAIVVSTVIILTAGTTTTLVIQNEHHVKVQTDFPKSSWTLAGYADPALALETVLWAGNHADGKTLLASMTPDLQQQLRQRFGDELQKQGISLEEFFTRSAKNHVSTVTGFRVLNQQIVADDQIILHLYVQGKEREDTFKMKKIGNEWKLDQFPPDY